MRILTATLYLLLAGCVPAPVTAVPATVETTAAATTERADAVVEPLQSATAEVTAPVVSAARGAVQAVLPTPAAGEAPPVSPAAVAHIVRWEVSSPAYYTHALQRPIWPGGASGVTWGIGYDGGHQSRQVILDDWHDHAARERLAGTAGITGARARAALPGFRDILTPFDHAQRVFAERALPVWHRTTVRAYGDGLLQLPPDARGALVGNTYNRGASMVGSRNAEKRAIRDECVPARDLACIAAQLRAQCRLWRGTNLEAGLCARREDEARLVEGSA